MEKGVGEAGESMKGMWIVTQKWREAGKSRKGRWTQGWGKQGTLGRGGGHRSPSRGI